MHPFWRAVFSNDLPVEVEIGPGTGTFLLAAAARCPHTNFLGIEHSHSRAERLRRAIEARDVRNTRVLTADASCVVARLIPPESVGAYHIYFPDPWWKRRHHRRRLFTAPFVAALTRTLVRGGRIFIATDVDDIFTLIFQTVAGFPALAHDAAARSPRPVVTAFERKGLARGATTKEATFVKPVSAPLALTLHTNSAAPMPPAESPS